MEKKIVYFLAALSVSVFFVVITVLLTVLYIDYSSHIQEHRSKPASSQFSNGVLNKDNPASVSILNGTKEFGEACNTTERCIDGFICNFDSKTCVCPHNEQEYLPKFKKCGSKVGGPCGDSTPCAKCSVCQRFRDSSNGLCACPEGVPVLKDERACDVDVGKDCSSSSDCKGDIGVACINGLCECEGFSRYIQSESKCVRLVGSSCDPRGRFYRSKGSQCAENSYCEKNNPWKYDSNEGNCKCLLGFEVSSDYTCVRSR